VKTIGVRDLQAHIGQVLADAQHEPVVVVRHSHPVAVVVGVRDSADAAKVVEQAQRLKKGDTNMNPPKTAVLYRFDEIARSAMLPLVSVSALRQRVRQDGITDRAMFDDLVFDLEADGIIELFVSGNPQSMSPEEQAGSLMTANRELIATAMRRQQRRTH
jgi:prevent-host-death family protein